jgi:hypothetical protein
MLPLYNITVKIRIIQTLLQHRFLMYHKLKRYKLLLLATPNKKNVYYFVHTLHNSIFPISATLSTIKSAPAFSSSFLSP